MSARDVPAVTLAPGEVAAILERRARVLEIGAEDDPSQKELWKSDDLKAEVFDMVCAAIDGATGGGADDAH